MEDFAIQDDLTNSSQFTSSQGRQIYIIGNKLHVYSMEALVT